MTKVPKCTGLIHYRSKLLSRRNNKRTNCPRIRSRIKKSNKLRKYNNTKARETRTATIKTKGMTLRICLILHRRTCSGNKRRRSVELSRFSIINKNLYKCHHKSKGSYYKIKTKWMNLV